MLIWIIAIGQIVTLIGLVILAVWVSRRGNVWAKDELAKRDIEIESLKGKIQSLNQKIDNIESKQQAELKTLHAEIERLKTKINQAPVMNLTKYDNGMRIQVKVR